MPSLANHQSNEFTKLTIEDVASYFNRQVMVNEHGCWIWLGHIDKRGYGRYGPSLVYNVVWKMAGLEIPWGHELCHKCQFKACFNPDHIYTGTHQQNMMDASRDGLMKGPRKVTDETIAEIVKLLDMGVSKSQAADSLGLSRSWMTKFIKGELRYAKFGQSSEQRVYKVVNRG